MNPESVAYAAAQRARLRAQQLSDRMPRTAGARLGALQRELGMLGYLVSEELAAEARRELRAQAKACCRVAVREPETAVAELSGLLADVERELGRVSVLPTHVLPRAADHLARARTLLAETLPTSEPRATAPA